MHTQTTAGPTDSARASGARPRWTPLLEGDARVQALERARGIAGALRRWLPQNAAASRSSLSGGGAGIAFFFAELFEVDGDAADRDVARDLLEQGLSAGWDRLNPSLFGGFPGAAWAVQTLGRAVGCEAGEEPLDETDARLLAHVSRASWREDYDLIQGLSGVGVYALERLPRPAAIRILEEAVARLDQLAVARDPGRTWFTPRTLLTESQRVEAPGGWYNLGLAHGAPGAIALLAAAAGRGVAREKAPALLRDAIRWILAQELPAGASSLFPAWISPGKAPVGTRLGWCYGDLGIAWVLLGASRWAGEPEWEHQARRIALSAAARSPAHTRVPDAGLCHGAAGIGHLLNRFYQSTGDERFAAAARPWFEETRRLRREGEGIDGYLHFLPEHGKTPRWLAEPGILTGAAGIGLALLSASSDREPRWDRFLLAPLPEVIS